MYIVTNGNAASQMSRLERSGLLPYVRDVFVSEDAGAAKPDVRYFDYAFSRIPGFEKERAEEEAKKLSITYQVGSFEEMRRVLL